MGNILRIQFPEDFEERYEKYKATLLTEQASSSVPHQQATSQKQLKEARPSEIKKFPHKLPSGTMWENFTITFLTDERVCVQVMGKNEELDYEALGFEDKRNASPDSQWILLRLLAKNQGEISWKNSEADTKFKKSKERLADQLRDYFSIDYDPFWPYKMKKSYKIKLFLIPPPGTRESVRDGQDTQDTIAEEIREIFGHSVE